MSSHSLMPTICCVTSCRSIGDVYAFVQQLVTRQTRLPRSGSRPDARLVGGAAGGSPVDIRSMAPLYRLVNRSGLRVSYWARSASPALTSNNLQRCRGLQVLGTWRHPAQLARRHCVNLQEMTRFVCVPDRAMLEEYIQNLIGGL